MVIRTLIRHIGCHFVSHERLDRHSNSGMSATVCPTALLACLRLYVRQHCWHVWDCMSDSIADMSATTCPTQRLCLLLCVQHGIAVMSATDSNTDMPATQCMSYTALLVCLRLYVRHSNAGNCMSDTITLVCLQLYVRHRIAGMSANVCPILHCWYVCNCMSHTALLVCLQLYVPHNDAGMSATLYVRHRNEVRCQEVTG